MKMRPKDELYIFIYDKDQIYIPSVSRVYGSDFRKISDVSRQGNEYTCIQFQIQSSPLTVTPSGQEKSVTVSKCHCKHIIF